MEESNKKAQLLTNNIVSFSQQNGNLLSKYNEKFFLQYFDRTNLGLVENQLKDKDQ